MPSGRQVATFVAVYVPALVASGLAIGGYHNKGLGDALLALAGLILIVGFFSVALRRSRLRRLGWQPLSVSHTLIGNRALLHLDLGTEPGITSVACEVHIPHYMRVGGIPKVNAEWRGGPSDRRATFVFPGDFGLPPIFSQAKVVGSYVVYWMVKQNGSPRILSDPFRFRRYTFAAAVRDAWTNRNKPKAVSFSCSLAMALSYQLLSLTRLGRSEKVQRLWSQRFLPPDGVVGPITLVIDENVAVRPDPVGWGTTDSAREAIPVLKIPDAGSAVSDPDAPPAGSPI